MSSQKHKVKSIQETTEKNLQKYEIYTIINCLQTVGDPFTYLSETSKRVEPNSQCGGTYHVMAGFQILSNTVADQRWLRGAIDKRYKLILVVFGEVFVFNLRRKRKLEARVGKYAYELDYGLAQYSGK